MSCLIHSAMSKSLQKTITRDALWESILPHAGQVLTLEKLKEIAWRIAGNLPRLKEGKYATPWTSQSEQEWMPMQIVASSLGRDYFDKLGATFQFRVLAGTACPLLIEKFWTRPFCGYLASDMGFSKPWGKYPFRDTCQFVGTRLYGQFTPETCEGAPMFEVISIPSAFKKANQELLKQRARIGFECPHGFTHACRNCHVGYDQCPAAVHPYTYETRECPACKRDMLFDKGSRVCIACEETKALAFKEDD
jgi:hypothetical protein